MAIYNLPNYKTADGFGMSLNIRRGNPNPLDNSSVWSSYEDALNYAQTSKIAYVGQLVTVVEFTEAVMDGETVTTPAQAKVDVYKIELGEDGVGTLTKVGAEEAEAAIAEIEETIEGIRTDLDTANTDIAGLGERLTPVETDLATAKEDIEKAEEAIGVNAEAIEGINGEIEQIKSDATTLSGTVSDHGTRISTLETEKASYAIKTEVETAISTAKQEAIDEAKDTLLGYLADDVINEDFDTLKEIAAWIEADKTNSTGLVTKVDEIYADYLKGADKEELEKAVEDAVDALETYIGTLPEDAVSTNIVAYINEVVTALKIGDYAKAADLTALTTRVSTLETDVDKLETDLSTLDGRVEAVEEALDELNGTVTEGFNTVNGTIEGLDGRIETLESKQITPTDVIGLADLLAGKVDTKSEEYTNSDGVTANVAHRLITPAEQDKLAKLAFDEDGKVTTGQQVAAGDVIGLADWLKTNGGTYIQGLDEDNFSDELITKMASHIKEIKVGDTTLTTTNGAVELPAATSTQYGIVKLGAEFKANDTTGALEIGSLNVNKLIQSENEYLELNGGNASGFGTSN